MNDHNSSSMGSKVQLVQEHSGSEKSTPITNLQTKKQLKSQTKVIKSNTYTKPMLNITKETTIQDKKSYRGEFMDENLSIHSSSLLEPA